MSGSGVRAIDARQVAAAHDRMAAEYDALDDLWYPALFARLHEFIAEHLPREGPRERLAIDAGCGTGFQSFLLARAGYRVTGLDIATELLAVARRKRATHAAPPRAAPPLFTAAPPRVWLARHHGRLAALLERARARRPVVAPDFVPADLAAFDYGDAAADAIVCCGSVLSFVETYDAVIARMAAGLRPGGLLFLEVEQKHNPDLLWPLIDRLLGGALGYRQGWADIAANLRGGRRAPARIAYPFALKGGDEVVLPIWLFAIAELEDIFRRCGLEVVDRVGIHQCTNLVPSPLLHRPDPSPPLAAVFDLLHRFDRRVGRTWPFWRLGCSVAFCLRKV
jgi:SAM-dependent methyltransferase